jgi:hypothetical protein
MTGSWSWASVSSGGARDARRAPVRGQPHAGFTRGWGREPPTAETLHGVPSPTRQCQALQRGQPMLPLRPRHSRSADPRLPLPWGDRAVRRPRRQHPARLSMPAIPASTPGVVAVRQEGGRGLPRPRAAPRLRQLPHPRTPRCRVIRECSRARALTGRSWLIAAAWSRQLM